MKAHRAHRDRSSAQGLQPLPRRLVEAQVVADEERHVRPVDRAALANVRGILLENEGHGASQVPDDFVEASARDGNPGVVLWGDGTATREFLYVEDAADGIIRATENYDKAEPINLGTGVEVPIRELAERIARLTGYKGNIVWDSSQPNGQPRRCLDVTLAEQLQRNKELSVVGGASSSLDPSPLSDDAPSMATGR